MLKSNLKQLQPIPRCPANPKRPRFIAQYERSILDQAEDGRDEGAICVPLRREGLYSTHLTTWRRQRQQGEMTALSPKKRGRKSTTHPVAERTGGCVMRTPV